MGRHPSRLFLWSVLGQVRWGNWELVDGGGAAKDLQACNYSSLLWRCSLVRRQPIVTGFARSLSANDIGLPDFARQWCVACVL